MDTAQLGSMLTEAAIQVGISAPKLRRTKVNKRSTVDISGSIKNANYYAIKICPIRGIFKYEIIERICHTPLDNCIDFTLYDVLSFWVQHHATHRKHICLHALISRHTLLRMRTERLC